MKKLTALAMVLGLSVSAFAGLTACDNTIADPPSVDTEVTKEEFAAAFTLGENYVCTADVVFAGLGIQRWEFKRADNLLESCIQYLNDDYTPLEGQHATYNFVEKVEDKVYYYTPNTNQDGTVNYYTKEQRTETFEYYEYDDLGALLTPLFTDIDLYTYNAETAAYEAASVVISDTMSATNLSWKFVNNKLVSGSYTMFNSQGTDATQMPVNFTITYGNATITLPTNVQS
jgi:hypothetical protein